MLGAIAVAPLLWPAMGPAQQARPTTRAISSSGDEALPHQRVGWADKPSLFRNQPQIADVRRRPIYGKPSAFHEAVERRIRPINSTLHPSVFHRIPSRRAKGFA